MHIIISTSFKEWFKWMLHLNTTCTAKAIVVFPGNLHQNFKHQRKLLELSFYRQINLSDRNSLSSAINLKKIYKTLNYFVNKKNLYTLLDLAKLENLQNKNFRKFAVFPISSITCIRICIQSFYILDF